MLFRSVYTNVEITDTETVKNLHKEVETKFSEEIKKNVVDTNRKVIRGNLNTGGNKNQTQAFESLFRKHSDNKQVKTSSKTDFRRLLSLNDRFLFQRELFKGDVGMMNYVFDEINSLNNADEFKDYLSQNFSWDYESPVVVNFLEIVDRQFTGKLI